MQKDQRGSHIVGLLVFVVVLGLVGFIGFRVYDKQKQKNNPVGDLSSWKQDCSGTGTVKMTHVPMDIDDVGSVMPLGLLAGAHVTPIDHLYFYPKDMKHRDAAPVYAMADGYIVDYSERTTNVDTGTSKKGEYRIVIQHSCTFYSYFDLMTSMDKDLQAKLKDGERHVAVKSGQVIGRVGAQSLDTAIYNLNLTLPGFVKPASYAAEPWKIHTDEFFKYFDAALADQMLALNPRTEEPRSGKIDYDIAGKLIGNWFVQGTNGYAGLPENKNGAGGNGYWSGHFSIAPDAITPAMINLSFGNYNGQPTQFTAVKGSADPATIGVADGVVKYELVKHVIHGGPSETGTGAVMYDNSIPTTSNPVLATAVLQVLDGNKLKLQVFPGKTASQVSGFTGDAKTYER